MDESKDSPDAKWLRVSKALATKASGKQTSVFNRKKSLVHLKKLSMEKQKERLIG